MIYPTGEMQMLFHFGVPFLNVTDELSVRSQKQYTLHGQNIKPGKIKACTNSGMIGAVFYPYSASAFIKFPLNEIAGMEMDVLDVFSSWRNYDDQYLNTLTINGKISVIEEFLLGQLEINSSDRYNLVKMFINDIHKKNGTGNISGLYKKFELNEKKAERLLKTYVGMSPKKYFDIARIQYAVEQLYKSDSLTVVACRSGYYDQSHFTRKFKEHTGITPTEFLKICSSSNQSL